MSAREFFADVLHGNFSHAYSRLADWYSGWPPELKAFVAKLTDDEGQILMATARGLLADALAGKDFNQIIDDAWDTIKNQVPGKAKSDLADALGVLKRS